MDSDATFPFDERLLEHQLVALRQLARRLLSDEQLAEDAVQQGALRAISRRFRDRFHQQRWMARVVRNAAHDLSRTRRSVEARERAVAREEALPGPEVAIEQLEQLEQAELLRSALRELEADDQRLLGQLYFEGQQAAELAASAGVSESGIRKRHARALERLRTRLDRRAGGRAAWWAGLAPFAGVPKPAPTGPAPSSSMAIAASVAVAAGLAVLVAVARGGAESRRDPLALGARESLASAAGAEVDRDAVRSELPPERPSVELELVRADTGEAVPGAVLRWWPAPAGIDAPTRGASWFRRGVLEERTNESANELDVDDLGRARAVLGDGGAVAIAALEQPTGDRLWGWLALGKRARGRVRVELHRDADLLVKVHDGNDAPLPGAIVSLRSLGYAGGDQEEYLKVVTDGNGFAVLKHAKYLRNASSDPATASAALTARVAGYTWPLATLNLESDEFGSEVHHLRIAEASAQVNVHVLDAHLQVESFELHMKWESDGDSHSEHYELDEGRLAIAVRTGDTEYEWDRTRFTAIRAEPASHLADGDAVQWSLAALPTGSRIATRLRGEAVDARGEPIAGHVLALFCGNVDTDARARTTESGQFEVSAELEEFLGRELELRLLTPSEKSGTRLLPEFRAQAGGEMDLGTVKLDLMLTLVEGRVVDEHGRGIEHASVELIGDVPEGPERLGALGYAFGGSSASLTENDGSFVLPLTGPTVENIGERLFTVVASYPGRATRMHVARAGDRDIALVLTPVRQLMGQVLLPPAIPAVDVWVEVAKYADEFGHYSIRNLETKLRQPTLQRVRLGLEGEFSFEDYGAGHIFCQVVRYGTQAHHGDAATLRGITRLETRDGRLDAIDLRSSGLRYARLELVDETQAPIQDLHVVVSDPEGHLWDGASSSYTDQRGRVSVLVPAGGEIRVNSSEYHNDVIAFDDFPATVRLQRRATLQFAIEGEPLSLKPGCELVATVEALDESCRFVRALPLLGEFECPAPSRRGCRVEFAVRHSGFTESIPELSFDIDPRPGEVHHLPPLDLSAVNAALERLRLRAQE